MAESDGGRRQQAAFPLISSFQHKRNSTASHQVTQKIPNSYPIQAIRYLVAIDKLCSSYQLITDSYQKAI